MTQLRNSGFLRLLGGRISTRATTFIASLIVARHYGPKEFGLYSYAVFVLAYVQMFGDGGTTVLGIRAVAAKESPTMQAVGQVLCSRFFYTAIASLAGILFGFYAGGVSSSTWMLVGLVLASLPLALSLEFAFIGVGKEVYASTVRMVGAFFLLAGTIAFVCLDISILWIPALIFVGNVMGIVVQSRVARGLWGGGVLRAMRTAHGAASPKWNPRVFFVFRSCVCNKSAASSERRRRGCIQAPE